MLNSDDMLASLVAALLACACERLRMARAAGVVTDEEILSEFIWLADFGLVLPIEQQALCVADRILFRKEHDVATPTSI